MRFRVRSLRQEPCHIGGWEGGDNEQFKHFSKPGIVTRAFSPQLQRQKQENRKFKATLGCIASQSQQRAGGVVIGRRLFWPTPSPRALGSLALHKSGCVVCICPSLALHKSRCVVHSCNPSIRRKRGGSDIQGDSQQSCEVEVSLVAWDFVPKKHDKTKKALL